MSICRRRISQHYCSSHDKRWHVTPDLRSHSGRHAPLRPLRGSSVELCTLPLVHELPPLVFVRAIRVSAPFPSSPVSTSLSRALLSATHSRTQRLASSRCQHPPSRSARLRARLSRCSGSRTARCAFGSTTALTRRNLTARGKGRPYVPDDQAFAAIHAAVSAAPKGVKTFISSASFYGGNIMASEEDKAFGECAAFADRV